MDFVHYKPKWPQDAEVSLLPQTELQNNFPDFEIEVSDQENTQAFWTNVDDIKMTDIIGCGTKLTGVQSHQIMPDTRTF